jgi:hypothetical protein
VAYFLKGSALIINEQRLHLHHAPRQSDLYDPPSNLPSPNEIIDVGANFFLLV